MKSFIATCLFIAFAVAAAAQKKTYFDHNWRKTSQKHASYYRITEKIQQEGRKPHYFVSDFYISGKPQMTGYYSDRSLRTQDGLFVYYSVAGNKETERHYVAGELHGTYTAYHANGQISWSVQYVNGKEEGPVTAYYETGETLSEKQYVHGKLEGPATSYFTDGAIQLSETYKNGKEEGPSTSYHENGQVFREHFYVNGEAVGKGVAYYEDGTLSEEVTYEAGKYVGECRWYHRNGKVSSIEYYTAGELQRFELYRVNGTRDNESTVTGYPAEFPGGKESMKRFLVNNMVYPQEALERSIEGKVYVSFAVSAEGAITDAEVLRSVYPELDEEALRVVNAMPDWKPGMDHGRIVKTYFNLPISFRLN